MAADLRSSESKVARTPTDGTTNSEKWPQTEAMAPIRSDGKDTASEGDGTTLRELRRKFQRYGDTTEAMTRRDGTGFRRHQKLQMAPQNQTQWHQKIKREMAPNRYYGTKPEKKCDRKTRRDGTKIKRDGTEKLEEMTPVNRRKWHGEIRGDRSTKNIQ